MSCDLCRIEFTALKRQKTCNICGSIQCSSCLRYKTKSHKPICIDCYYDGKSGNNPDGKADKIASLRCTAKDKNCSENCKVPPNHGMETDNIIKRLEAIKVPKTEVKDSVASLESRLQQLKGPTNKKPSCSMNTSKKKEDEVTRLIKQYTEEALIDKKCGITFSDKEQLSDVATTNDDDPWCCMCDEDANMMCQECDDYFCKRCFNKTHNKRERAEHRTEVCRKLTR